MCVWGVKHQKIFGKCEKGKGKEGERHLSASVVNSPSALYKGRRHDHVYIVWFLYKRILKLAVEC